MREIKFRAWHQEGLSKPEDNKYSMTYWKLGQGLDNSWFYSHSKAIMQFTGLHDKNGKEIYESDRVELNGDKYEIKYGDGCFWLSPSGGSPMALWEYYDLLEVKGNIYEG